MAEYKEHIITIWAPRWHDRVALIAKRRVKDGNNFIRFSGAATLPHMYAIDGADIRSCTLGSNGKIPCYEVPLDMLRIDGEMFA